MGPALAQDKTVQADILTGKITTLIKAGKQADALPYFEQLEAMDVPHPESFYFFYIDALDKADKVKPTIERGNQFLEKYGRNSKYYADVIAIVSRRSIELDKANAETAARLERRQAELAEQQRNCVSQYKSDLASAQRDLQRAEAACDRSTYSGNSFCFGYNNDGKDNQRRAAWDSARDRLENLKSGSPCN